MTAEISLALLHEGMVDKQGKHVTTSLTLNDMQDLARSCKTYGLHTLFIAHPSAALRKLARRLEYHWEQGFGAGYNSNRKEAIEIIQIVSTLDEAIAQIDMRCGKLPLLVSTSAKHGQRRTGFSELAARLATEERPVLILLGTGWGMAAELLNRAEVILEPIEAASGFKRDFNHLSVRSAGAIILDRLFGGRDQ